MKKINLNFEAKTIELNESFAKKARIYKSEAYEELMNVQKNHPAFEIVVLKSTPKKNTSVKGINYDYMRKYVETHDESKELLKEFDKLKDGKTPFFEVKKWFLAKFPEIQEYKDAHAKRVQEILSVA